MADCLSEDDEKEHHPVFLTCFVLQHCTSDADAQIHPSHPAHGHILKFHSAMFLAVLMNLIKAIPVFHPGTSKGMTGR